MRGQKAGFNSGNLFSRPCTPRKERKKDEKEKEEGGGGRRKDNDELDDEEDDDGYGGGGGGGCWERPSGPLNVAFANWNIKSRL